MNTNAPSYIPSYAKEEGGDDLHEKYQRLKVKHIMKTKSSRIDRSNEFGRLGVLNGMN